MQDQRFGDHYLWRELRWVVRLRWVTGLIILIVALTYPAGMPWADSMRLLAWVGGGILVYNAILFASLRRFPRRGATSQVQAWSQILLDLAALTLVVRWTGQLGSPVLGFYVFHMVFASILLTRPTAYMVAAIAVGMLCVSLVTSGDWPGEAIEAIVLVGWVTLQVLTVYLSTHVTRSLKRQRLRALARSRRLRSMSRRLAHQQQAMIQHEKSVALGQMAAGLAHEIANPLANMDSLLQLMQRRPDKPAEDSVAKLREQVDRIRRVIEHMTRFAHPTDSEWEVLGFDELVDGALGMIQFDRRWKKVALERDIACPSCRFRVQAHAFQQVLVNVLINALDALENTDEPKIRIVSRCSDEQCRIEIHDNGPGIAEQAQRQAFDAFFTTKPVGRGTGLGLSISKELLARQGGRISIERAEGVGTVVRVTMPAGQNPPS